MEPVIQFEEHIFRPAGQKNVCLGKRSITAELISAGNASGIQKLRVLKSTGVFAVPSGSIIQRPAFNLLNHQKNSNPSSYFKPGGYVAQVKDGKATPMPDATKGGMSIGARHSEDGIKGRVGTEARPIEFEGKEIILTAPVTDDKRQYQFEGKQMSARQIASYLNVQNGGVEFADGGTVRCSGKEYNFGGRMVIDRDIVSSLNNCGCENEVRGFEIEKAEHYDTLSKLNAGSITINQAITEIVQAHLKEDPNYYCK